MKYHGIDKKQAENIERRIEIFYRKPSEHNLDRIEDCLYDIIPLVDDTEKLYWANVYNYCQVLYKSKQFISSRI